MKKIYYSQEAQFVLTDEEFTSAILAFNKGENVWISRLQVHLSQFYKWAGESKSCVKNQTTGRLNDGQRVFKIGGIWKDAEGRIIDPQYYPEVAKDNVMSEEEWDERDKRIIKIYESNCNFSTKPRMGKRAKTNTAWQDDGRLRASK